jgi:hypothetical protein
MAKSRKLGVVARRRSLPRGTPLLVGRVRVEGFRPPVLLLEVWCPWCKRLHVHGWSGDDRRADHVEHRVAHCLDGSPLQGQGYYVGLDPAAREENRRAFAAFERLLAAAARHRRPPA